MLQKQQLTTKLRLRITPKKNILYEEVCQLNWQTFYFSSMLKLKLKSLWHPEMFQGWGKTKNYFEGWYIKCVSADEQHAIAFIPGISLPATGESHAFVQIMFGSENRSAYHRFQFSDFQPSTENFNLQLERNTFSNTGITLSLPEVEGSLSFENPVQWPKMLGAPGIMGWFGYLPFMQCFHGIISMNHNISGQLMINDKLVDFTGGKGYIEKDWGRSFPRAYVWMQSNHFPNSDASLIASVAHIPFLGSHFIGFICGFWYRGKIHRFATYTGAKKTFRIEDDHVSLKFTNPNNALHIKAFHAPGTSLVSPMSGAMTGKINESMQAKIEVEYYENNQLVFHEIGSSAGLEVCLPEGDMEGKVLW